MFLMKSIIDFYIVIFFQYISNKKGKKKKKARKYAHNYSSLNDFGEEVNLI